jgi:adenylosuccinate lyase
MPLPERYAIKVPEVVDLWTGAGYFKAQGEVWLARARARGQIKGSPSSEELALMEQALILPQEDIDYINNPTGHETNRYLERVQGRLPARVGNYLHEGMTSSDLLDTGLALQHVRSLDLAEVRFEKLADALLVQAAEHRKSKQIGRTHGQHAAPQTWGRQVIGWYAEVKRGVNRIRESRDAIAVGKCSGEVGTNVFISPEEEELTMEYLGLVVDPAPTQVVSRDRHAQVAMNMAVNAGTLSRIAGNLQTLGRTEINEVQEPFDPSKQKGSSSMPHKQNTEITERVEGLSEWVQESAFAVLKSMRLKEERHIAHSSTERFAYQDLYGGLIHATDLLTDVIVGARVHPDRMLVNMGLTRNRIYSPRVMNELLQKDQDTPRKELYDFVREFVLTSIDDDSDLQDLVSKDPKIQGLFTPVEIAAFFDPEFYLKNVGMAWKRLGLQDPAES